MKRTVEAPEVRNYLAALEARLAHLPADQSDEILFGVREHITEALARGEQSVTEVLTSLGSPDDVLAEPTGAGYPAIAPNSAPALGSAPAPAGLPAPLRSPGHRNSTPWVVLTAALLPFGGFLWGFGWLLGVAGLWMGTRWKVWEKIVGTLLFPGGILGVLYSLSWGAWESDSSPVEVTTDTGAGEPVLPGIPLSGTLLAMTIPLVVAIYLLVVGLIRRPRQQ